MLTKRTNPKSNNNLIAFDNGTGCCGDDPANGCMYLGRFDGDIDEITSIVYKKDGVDTTILIGVAVDAADMNTIHAAIKNALTSPEPDGGGFYYHDGDIKVYIDNYAGGLVTIGIISETDIVSMDINEGGDTIEFDKGCVSGTFCPYVFQNTLGEDLKIVIDGAIIGTANEATVEDLVAAIDVLLDAAGYTTSAIKGKENEDDAGIADLALWLPVNVLSVWIDDVEISRGNCSLKYIVIES